MTVWLICGGRAFANQALFDAVMRSMLLEYGMPDKVVHGAARGADSLAGEWAERLGIEVVPVPADWLNTTYPDAEVRTNKKTGEQYDRKAGPRRNQRMLDEYHPDLTIAFQGMFGTTDMIMSSCAARVRNVIVKEDGEMQTIDFPPLD